MRSFVALLLICYYVAVTNARQETSTQSEVVLPNVRRSNSNDKKDGSDIDSVQRLPSSDVTLVNNITAANQLMTQLQQYSTYDVDKERDLQIDAGTILNIVDTACDLVGTLMLLEGTAVCDCTLTLSLEFGCKFVTDVCTGSFCTTPDVRGAFDVLQTRVTFTYCSNNGAFNDITLPDFCVSVSGDLIPPGVSSTSSEESVLNKNTSVSEDRARIFGKGNILRKVQFLDTITVTVDDQVCRSASICNNGQGYIFDCTNINALLKQSTCTPIQTLTNLQQEPGSVVFLPQLDDPPPSNPLTSITAYFNNFQALFKLLQNP
jgi:hypothetical protein